MLHRIKIKTDDGFENVFYTRARKPRVAAKKYAKIYGSNVVHILLVNVLTSEVFKYTPARDGEPKKLWHSVTP